MNKRLDKYLAERRREPAEISKCIKNYLKEELLDGAGEKIKAAVEAFAKQNKLIDRFSGGREYEQFVEALTFVLNTNPSFLKSLADEAIEIKVQDMRSKSPDKQ